MNDSNPVRIAQWGMTAGRGGLESFIMNLYRHIDRSRIQFDFLEPVGLPRMAYEDEIEEMGGHVYRVMESQIRHPLKAGKALRAFFHSHPEIVAVHANANAPYAYVLKVAQQCGIKLRVLHSHNSNAMDVAGDNIVKRSLWSARDHIIRAQIDRYPTSYLACSGLAAEYMFPGKNYTFVPNGIDTAHFAFDNHKRAGMRSELGLNDLTTVIGFCGWLIERKNPLFALDVFRHYHQINSDSVLLIIGTGPLHEALERRIAEYDLRDSVRLLGDRKDMHRLYQAMDAFMLPSLFEGLSIVYVEAQCAGLPTLASSTSAPETAITKLLRFVSLDDNVDVWADRLVEIMQDNMNIERSIWASEVKEKGFDSQSLADSMAKFYERELAEKGRDTNE